MAASVLRLSRTLLVLAAVLCSLHAHLGLAKRAFSADEAWRYHHYTRASYCDGGAVASWTCGAACAQVPGFEVQAVLNGTAAGTSGFVGVDHAHRQVVVAFRGSDNLQSWLDNVLQPQTPYTESSSCGSGCGVHVQFMEGYLAVREELRAAVLALLSTYANYSVVLTGHSLGGALATLAAADLQELLNRGRYPVAPQPVSLYTYGSPRVGNPAFAAWLDDLLSSGASYRVTHGHDPVVRLPVLSWGYRHPSGEVFYANLLNSSRVVCDDSATRQDPRCSAGRLSTYMEYHLQYMGENTDCDSQAPAAAKDVPQLSWMTSMAVMWEFMKGRL